MIAEKLKRVTPLWARKLVPQTVKDRILGTTRIEMRLLHSLDYLNGLMLRYQVKDLVNVDPKSFREKIDQFLELKDAAMEGFQDPAVQRDFSTKFRWGHDHDFGDFFIKGQLGIRHLTQEDQISMMKDGRLELMVQTRRLSHADGNT